MYPEPEAIHPKFEAAIAANEAIEKTNHKSTASNRPICQTKN